MSLEFIPGPEIGGDRMPWGTAIVDDKWVFMSGITGRHPDWKQEYPEAVREEDWSYADSAAMEVAPHSIEEQVEICLERTERMLEEAGTSFSNVYYVDYYLVNEYDWLPARRKIHEWMIENGYEEFAETEAMRPGVQIFVDALNHPDMLIEIKMWAVKPD